MNSPPDFTTRYMVQLRSFLRCRSEEALMSAYELGRESLVEGRGILDVLSVHRSCLENVSGAKSADGGMQVVDAASRFLDEVLSPFEMARLSSREANMALRKLFDLHEQETTRIAYELHDDSAQMLATVYLELASIARDVPEPVAERVRNVSRHLDGVREQLRNLSHDLRPLVLDQLGLGPALRFLAKGVSDSTGLRMNVDCVLDHRLDQDVETALYRVIQEAVSNVVKHADAQEVSIDVWTEGGDVRCAIVDDGTGLALDQPIERGLGLVAIEERLASINGNCDLTSEPGKGVRLEVRIPQ